MCKIINIISSSKRFKCENFVYLHTFIFSLCFWFESSICVFMNQLNSSIYNERNDSKQHMCYFVFLCKTKTFACKHFNAVLHKFPLCSLFFYILNEFLFALIHANICREFGLLFGTKNSKTKTKFLAYVLPKKVPLTTTDDQLLVFLTIIQILWSMCPKREKKR